MNYDAWMTSDVAFDRYHGLLDDDRPEPEYEPDDWREELIKDEENGRPTDFD